EDKIVDALGRVEGAYSLVLMTVDALVAVRDPRGFRPLCLGVVKRPGEPDAHVVASEPTSFDLIGAELVRDVAPGEMIVVDKAGLRSWFPFARAPRKLCIFEHVYFARPDARIDGAAVYEVRKALGRRLAEEHPPPIGPNGGLEDVVVIPVPDSGVPAAIGYAGRAGAAFELGLIRSHYVGRTFIEPQQQIRHFGVRLKLNPNRGVIEGKRVVVIDDSIVRGTTSRKIVRMLREAGAREVHVRISSPPTEWPCYYGIDTPTRSELIASKHAVDEIRDHLTADSLGYLSLDGLVDAIRAVEGRAHGGDQPARDAYCHACFSGDYSVPVRAQTTRGALHLVR
ncbi:MAG TPA: amidophosphoribosyltransferase, partial [Byssovorax sp.]